MEDITPCLKSRVVQGVDRQEQKQVRWGVAYATFFLVGLTDTVGVDANRQCPHLLSFRTPRSCSALNRVSEVRTSRGVVDPQRGCEIGDSGVSEEVFVDFTP